MTHSQNTIDAPRRAVVLLSGGLDSAVSLAVARDQGYRAYALTVDYGQRHRVELTSAQAVAQALGAQEHRIIRVGLDAFGGSALTDPGIAVPMAREAPGPDPGIPATYVPARNTVLLALALSWAEVLAAEAIFIGANQVDYSGYPDCRPAFLTAFEELARLATRAGVEGAWRLAIQAPLLHRSKADIIRLGQSLGVDFSLTTSCYNPSPAGRPCNTCEACGLRAKGFSEAGLSDPAIFTNQEVS